MLFFITSPGRLTDIRSKFEVFRTSVRIFKGAERVPRKTQSAEHYTTKGAGKVVL